MRNWPAETPINWSTVAREHSIPGANGGQVAQEFAEIHGIDISQIQSATPNRKITVRPTKKKLPGTDIRHVRIQIFPIKKNLHATEYYNVSMVITPHYSELRTPNLHQRLQES